MSSSQQYTQRDERFDVVRRIGAGAMGVVFHVRDRKNAGQDVALKVLKRFDASALYRFKREFRTLADVVHPNLVSLYELLSFDERWMFTMELVDGVEFSTYVRGPSPAEQLVVTDPLVTQGTATTDTVRVRPAARGRGRSMRPMNARELDRLRRALPQLVDAVHAIHTSGKLHRDLKPSNVLVDRGGRVVVLDFGVATGLLGSDQTASQGVVGTPAYMAPEQALGEELTAACDWYAVGVMIYESLSGCRPFEGNAEQVLSAKVERAPTPIDQLAPDAPADLRELCNALLIRNPAARPRDEEIRRLVGAPVRAPVSRGRAEADETPLLVGRNRELGALGDALEAATDGAGSVMHVRGASGMGKTALVETFLRQIEERSDVMVVRGRCYEHESVPYKALDSLIDALAGHLAALPESDALALIPRDIAPLVRLFPVLRRVDALVVSGVGATAIDDPVALRLRAFGALRALIDRLCEHATPVLYIDDLQWGDTDSAELLSEVFPAGDLPPALLILAYRPEEDTSPFLRAFGAPRDATARINVGRLPLSSARELASALLPGTEARSSRIAETIAREAGGSPFFVRELARYVLAADDVNQLLDQSWHISLEDVLSERIGELSADARRVLELIAVATNPIPQAIALTGANLGPADAPLLVALRSEHLVRTSGVGASSTVETAHDRIRETIVARLDPDDRRRYHARIARELQRWERADPEAIAVHLEAAGELDRVPEYLLAAATNAVDGLAFDRAAALRIRALELTAPDAPERHQRLIELGEALGFAGRSTAAADAYLQAAAATDAASGHDLRKLAAEHLLYSGQIDRGVEVLDGVLEEVGVRRPRSQRSVLLSLLVLRARLALRGSSYPVGDTAATDEQRRVLEACWSAGIGFSMVDTFRSVEFSARHLLAALDTGDAFHISRGLTAEACLVCLTGGSAIARGRKISTRAVEIATDLGRPDAIQWAESSVAFVDYMAGEWTNARQTISRGIELFTKHRTGFAWELNSVRTYELWCLFYLGELTELSTKLAAFLREARERGDLHSATTLSVGLPSISWLARDRPDVAHTSADRAMSEWTHRSVHLQHFWAVMSHAFADLYEGKPGRVVDRLQRNWRPFKKAMFLRIQMVRLELLWLRASAHLGEAQDERKRPAALRRAAADARRIARTDIIGYRHIATAMYAAIAARRGDDARARDLLDEAIIGFDDRGMTMHAACARLRLGEMADDDDARAGVARALAWAERHDVVAPLRFARLIVPGAFGRA